MPIGCFPLSVARGDVSPSTSHMTWPLSSPEPHIFNCQSPHKELLTILGLLILQSKVIAITLFVCVCVSLCVCVSVCPSSVVQHIHTTQYFTWNIMILYHEVFMYFLLGGGGKGGEKRGGGGT